MELSTWLLTQYEKWRSESDSAKTLADFAAYLDVPPTSLSNWINAGSKMRADTISKISEKLGPEIYDVLGLHRPSDDISKYPPEIKSALAKAIKRVDKLGIRADSEESINIFIEELSKVDSKVISKTEE